MTSTGPSYPMDIFLYVKRGVVLNNPINFRNVKTSRSDVSTEKYSLFEHIKFIKGERPFLLLLFAMNFHYINIDVVQEIRVEFDAVAGGEEDHHFLFLLLLLS